MDEKIELFKKDLRQIQPHMGGKRTCTEWFARKGFGGYGENRSGAV